jgi:hypothetical protein
MTKILADGGIVGQFMNEHEDPDSCGGTRKQFYVAASHAGRKEMLALLVAALHTGARISVYVSGCTQNSNPNDVWPIVSSMDAIP